MVSKWLQDIFDYALEAKREAVSSSIAEDILDAIEERHCQLTEEDIAFLYSRAAFLTGKVPWIYPQPIWLGIQAIRVLGMLAEERYIDGRDLVPLMSELLKSSSRNTQYYTLHAIYQGYIPAGEALGEYIKTIKNNDWLLTEAERVKLLVEQNKDYYEEK